MSDADGWDRRYQASALVRSAEPTQTVAEHCAELSQGRALDLATGEGRNSIWLACQGWRVTAVDFSTVALDKGRRIADAQGAEVAARIDWVTADVVAYRPDLGGYDLVIIAYLHLPAPQRGTILRSAATATAPGGMLLVIAHDSTNLDSGTGGPQDPAVLYSPSDVTTDLDGSGLRVEVAKVLRRHVDGHPDAIDALVIARRPDTAA